MKDAVSAVVIASGLGTRLGKITEHTAKPMLEFGGKPYIGYLIDWLKASSIDDIVITTHTHHEQIEAYISKAYDDVRTVVEPALISTIHSTKVGLDAVTNRTSLILTADNIWEVSIAELITQHRAYNAYATALVTANPLVPNAGKVSVDINDDHIVEMWPSDSTQNPPPHTRPASTMGLYVVDKTELLKSIRPTDTSIEREPMNRLVPRVAALWNEGFFYDFGTPEKYQKLKANPLLITQHLHY